MTPDWTGNPQHVIAGVVLALATYALARRRSGAHPVVLAAFSVIVTMAAEAMVELVEYPLVFGDAATAKSYYDTIADIGATLAGAVVAALAAMAWSLWADRSPDKQS